jgi:hypothetical protein
VSLRRALEHNVVAIVVGKLAHGWARLTRWQRSLANSTPPCLMTRCVHPCRGVVLVARIAMFSMSPGLAPLSRLRKKNYLCTISCACTSCRLPSAGC